MLIQRPVPTGMSLRVKRSCHMSLRSPCRMSILRNSHVAVSNLIYFRSTSCVWLTLIHTRSIFVLPCTHKDKHQPRAYKGQLYARGRTYTAYAGPEFLLYFNIASPFSRQIANANAGPTSALDSMGAKLTFRCNSFNIALGEIRQMSDTFMYLPLEHGKYI